MEKISEEEVTSRTNIAVENFMSGYNCAQSVAMAYADRYQLDLDTLKALSGSFGGGMGRLREVCGAVSGMFLILGMAYPAGDPADKEAKTANYAAVQRTAFAFKEKMGSYICADLLKIGREPQEVIPDDRNKEYYAKRPCAMCIAVAANILGKELLESGR